MLRRDTLNEQDLNHAQRTALNKIRRLHSSTINTEDKYRVRQIADIGRGAVIVFGHQGAGDEPRWYDHNYSFTIGPRGAITMVDGPTCMAAWQGKRWCGINISIR